MNVNVHIVVNHKSQTSFKNIQKRLNKKLSEPVSNKSKRTSNKDGFQV